MNIGDKIINVTQTVRIDEITNIVPVQYKDDGSEVWFEVCDASTTDYVAIIGTDTTGNESIAVINKGITENIDMLSDLL